MEYNGLRFADGIVFWLGFVVITSVALMAGFVPGALFSNMNVWAGLAVYLVSVLAWLMVTSTNLLAGDGEALKQEKTFEDAREQAEVQEEGEDKLTLNAGCGEARSEAGSVVDSEAVKHE